MFSDRVDAGARRDTEIVLMWLGGGLLLTVLWGLLIIGQLNLLIALILAIPLLLLSVHNKQLAIVCAFGYLILLGDIRRIVAVIAAPAAFDPLLLIVPAVTLVLVAPLLFGLRLSEPLSKAVLGLLFIMLLEIFNPQQGGIGVGLSGVFFYVFPVSWFWIGRSYGSVQLLETLIYKIVLPLALFAGLLGLAQNFIGFLPYQKAWLDTAG